MTFKQSCLFHDFDTSDKLDVLRGLYRAEAEPLRARTVWKWACAFQAEGYM